MSRKYALWKVENKPVGCSSGWHMKVMLKVLYSSNKNSLTDNISENFNIQFQSDYLQTVNCYRHQDISHHLNWPKQNIPKSDLIAGVDCRYPIRLVEIGFDSEFYKNNKISVSRRHLVPSWGIWKLRRVLYFYPKDAVPFQSPKPYARYINNYRNIIEIATAEKHVFQNCFHRQAF